MNELIKELQQATYHEYVRATKENGYCFNSGHEAYAVIKEEYEEAVEEMDKFVDYASEYWEEVKNDRQSNVLSNMREYAIKAAAELIQTAAMCEKAMIRRMKQDG